MKDRGIKILVLMTCASVVTACGLEAGEGEDAGRQARSLVDPCQAMLVEAESAEDPQQERDALDGYQECVMTQADQDIEGELPSVGTEACLEILEEAIRLPDDAPLEEIERAHQDYVSCVEDAIYAELDGAGDDCLQDQHMMCDDLTAELGNEDLSDEEREELEREASECYENITPCEEEIPGDEDCFTSHFDACDSMLEALEDEGNSDEDLRELEAAIDECYESAEEVCGGFDEGYEGEEDNYDEDEDNYDEDDYDEDNYDEDNHDEDNYDDDECDCENHVPGDEGEENEGYDEDDCPETQEHDLPEACFEILDEAIYCEDDACFEAIDEAFEACLQEHGF